MWVLHNSSIRRSASDLAWLDLSLFRFSVQLRISSTISEFYLFKKDWLRYHRWYFVISWSDHLPWCPLLFYSHKSATIPSKKYGPPLTFPILLYNIQSQNPSILLHQDPLLLQMPSPGPHPVQYNCHRTVDQVIIECVCMCHLCYSQSKWLNWMKLFKLWEMLGNICVLWIRRKRGDADNAEGWASIRA